MEECSSRETFYVRTLEECYFLAKELTQHDPQAALLRLGLQELLVNAVEHGNLGITYQEKKRLLREGHWQEEVNLRLHMSENRHKQVTLEVANYPQKKMYIITDEGGGFDWAAHSFADLSMTPTSHGRGIFLAKTMCFDHVEYLGKGNQVMCWKTRPSGE